MRQTLCFSGMFFLLLFAGCGGGVQLPEGMPQPQPTTITITQEGKPLAGASVALIPADAALSKWNAGAITDSSGNAHIKTLQKYDGVVPGKFMIIITKTESDESKLTAPDPNSDPEGYSKYMAESQKEKIASYNLIDPKYSKSTTPEKIEIVQGKNEKTIEVGPAVRVKR